MQNECSGKQMIAVSACLAGMPCRYDGQSKPVPEIQQLVAEGKAVTICPEVLGGLPTPRIPSERNDDYVINEAGEDVTEAFKTGAERALEIVRKRGCRNLILKAKSPSCGYGQIYDGTFTRTLKTGNGIFAEMAAESGMTIYNENNFQRLNHE